MFAFDCSIQTSIGWWDWWQLGNLIIAVSVHYSIGNGNFIKYEVFFRHWHEALTCKDWSKILFIPFLVSSYSTSLILPLNVTSRYLQSDGWCTAICTFSNRIQVIATIMKLLLGNSRIYYYCMFYYKVSSSLYRFF